jgi:hypothetical protein
MHRLICCAALGAAIVAPAAVRAAVIINEVVYDDGGTDDREFVELFNSGPAAVNIGGWTISGQDASGANSTTTITAGTVLDPGGFYVIGNTGVLNVNQTAAGGFLENDAETVELRNGGTLVDAVLYESNKGTASHGTLPADVTADVGPGIWGNNQSSDLAGTPLISSAGLARFVDGRDTNNNGRDWGFRRNTPGTSNNPVNITSYTVPDVAATAVGTDLPGFGYSFVPPRVIDPSVVDANNPNAIPPAPSSPNRAIVAWDPSGGGNAVSSNETFSTAQSSFDIFAYLDTRDFPQMSNATGTLFRGSEITVYGIGGVEALNNLTDISGQVGVTESANGTTGVAWIYEKVAAPSPNDPVGPSNQVSEKLYLVDAGDGGDAGQGGTIPFDWTILATVDLSATPSGWYRLGIDIDATGNGVARYENQTFNFTTGLHSGAFGVAYRENTQLGADGTPDAILRPPTFAAVPEPGTLLLAMFALLVVATARRTFTC